MATVRDYFDTDMKGVASVQEVRQARDAARGLDLEVVARVHLDFNAHTKYVSFFLVDATDPIEACAALIAHPEWALNIADRLRYQPRFTVEPQPHSQELPFSGRVFIYAERDFSEVELSDLRSYAKESGVILSVRGLAYAKKRAEEERALAFISHDSGDKDEIARPLALELALRLVPVWFDEYSLRPGASLRESIERGIKECSKCVLIVSPRFLQNSGWTKAEFDSIFTREILDRSNYILPVWAEVTARDVYEYSPRLADKVAIPWSLGVKEVARQLAVEILAERAEAGSYRKFAPVIEPAQPDPEAT